MNTYEELLNNPEKLAGMTFEEIEAASQPKDGEPVESPATPAEVDKPVTDEPQGIADKTGSKIIPYEVLTSERNKSTELAKGKADAEARIAELEAKLANAVVADADVDESLFLSQDEIDALAEELPNEAQRTVKMQDLIRRQAALLQQKEVETQRFQQSLVRDNTQLAIDSVPKLAFIQATKPVLFNLAVEIDKQLRAEAETDTTIAGMSLSERFTLAVSRLEAEIGVEIDMKPSSKPSSEQLKQAATQAKNVADVQASATPLSMADIPGGAIPAVDEYASFFEKSPAEMEAAMSKMTEAQKNKLYDRIR